MKLVLIVNDLMERKFEYLFINRKRCNPLFFLVYIIIDIGDENLQDMIKNLHNQYAKISDVSYSDEYIPPDARRMIWKELVQDLLMKTLQYEMENRPDINTLLHHPYNRLP